MANRPAPALILREGDREELTRWTRPTSMRAGLVMRARIVLAAAAGEANEHIARQESTTRTTVIKWQGRYQDKGLAKVTDVVGLYLDPPQNAIVLCVDEKSQIQALD